MGGRYEERWFGSAWGLHISSNAFANVVNLVIYFLAFLAQFSSSSVYMCSVVGVRWREPRELGIKNLVLSIPYFKLVLKVNIFYLAVESRTIKWPWVSQESIKYITTTWSHPCQPRQLPVSHDTGSRAKPLKSC